MSESGLRRAVLEIDSALASGGWDQPARLYALVDTRRLLEREPALAGNLGLKEGREAPPVDGLTAVEQDALPSDQPLEDVLAGIEWPEEVDGCAAAVERLVLPPSAENSLPEDPLDLRTYAAHHPDRRDVRIVAAALRDGRAHCTLRIRGRITEPSTGHHEGHHGGHHEGHDNTDETPLLEGPDLVPGLVALITDTLTGRT